MNTNALRQKILDLAIHGKLVKQDPADESATILLEKIRAEKEKKIASGELKRGKNDSYIFFGDDNRHYEKFADGRVKDIEDEIPFAVPEGWAWASLSEIANIYTGNSINENEKNKKYSNVSDGLFYIATEDIDFEGVINYENGIKIPFSESKFKIAPAQSSLICIEGGSAGRKIGFINKEVCFVNKLCCLHCEFIDNLYLFYYLRSSTFIDFFNVNKSGLIGGVSLNLLKRIPLPLPPLAEQKCIVTVIETIFAQIDLLEQNKADLQTVVKQVKSKILDLAIRGKLVPQDPDDEPASVMLEKLRVEKEAKIASGEIKRGKNDSYIYKNSTDNCYYQKYTDGCEENISDEIPFAVPEGWAWCRLGEVGQYKKGPFGSTLTKSIFVPKSDNTIKVYEQKNVIQKRHTLGEYYITREYFESNMKGFEVFPGDILVSCAGTIGETYILPDDIEQGIINQALMKMSITRYIDKFYFLKYFDHRLKEIAAASGKGIAIKNIPPFDVFKNFLFPLPPLAEQKRIVTKIEELFAQLDFITTTLTK